MPHSNSIAFLLVDGKLGGLDASGCTRRLETKLRYEDIPEHQWLLRKYKAGVEDTASVTEKHVSNTRSDKVVLQKLEISPSAIIFNFIPDALIEHLRGNSVSTDECMS